MKLDVSVVICSRDRPALLADAVAAVLRGDAAPAEIVVVDQSRQPHPTLATHAEPTVRYIHTHTVGVSRSRNRGIAVAQYDRVALIDDDVLVAPDWLRLLIGALAESERDTVVTGSVLEIPGSGADAFAPSTTVSVTPSVYRGRQDQDVLYTGNMALNRAILKRVGGFDERLGPGTRFPAAEDNDLAFRLLDAGIAVRFVPEAVVYHRAWRSTDEYLRLRWRYARGQGAFYAKHLRLDDGFMRRRMCRHLSLLAQRTRRRALNERRVAWDQVVAMAGILTGASQWLLTHRRAR